MTTTRSDDASKEVATCSKRRSETIVGIPMNIVTCSSAISCAIARVSLASPTARADPEISEVIKPTIRAPR